MKYNILFDQDEGLDEGLLVSMVLYLEEGLRKAPGAKRGSGLFHLLCAFIFLHALSQVRALQH
eukprot:1158116-Pelagomonas_calceolata.AAC.7